MHDVPRKDREDADDVDEDEVSEISGGFTEPDGTNIPVIPGYPRYPGGIREPGLPDDVICPDPYIE